MPSVHPTIHRSRNVARRAAAAIALAVSVSCSPADFFGAPPAASLVLITGQLPVIRMGDVVKFTLPRNDEGEVPGWTSSDTSVAFIDSAGVMHARRPGPVRITAATADATVNREIVVDAAVLTGAGDIAACESAFGHDLTAEILDSLSGWVFTAGDNTYPNGTRDEWMRCYAPTWGRHKARTFPTMGNHDILTEGGAPYFEYWGAAAGERFKGYYHRQLGTWHIFGINSNLGFAERSEQLGWFRAQLATVPRSACIMAIWHHPRFSSSATESSESRMATYWSALTEVGADVIVNGHAHDYERFDPQLANGQPSAVGVRAFVVGTGGATLFPTKAPERNSVVLQATTFGVLKFELGESSYRWEFIGAAGQEPFTDSGSATCLP